MMIDDIKTEEISAEPKTAAAPVHSWGIILAGGEGTRMRGFIEGRQGFSCPKQYCAFYGGRSMLRHTIDRASKLTAVERLVTVIGPGHRQFFDREEVPGTVIEQPTSRDTLAGVFLPASYILSRDPEATVVIFPSDHFVFPEERFIEQLRCACGAAQSLRERIILIAAVPNRVEADYGWIEPGDEVKDCRFNKGKKAFQVSAFHEKPSRAEARRYFEGGFLLNTMIMAAQLKTFWKLGWELVPKLMRNFEIIAEAFRNRRQGAPVTEQEENTLSQIYHEIPSLNFSRVFLPRAVKNSIVLPMDGVFWSDWGRPERVRESLHLMREQCSLFSPGRTLCR